MKSAISSHVAFSAFILAFITHNIDEAIYICRYPVQSPVSFIEPATCKQFIIAVLIITTLVLIAFIFAIRTKKSALYLLISTAIASALVFNVLVPHLIIVLYTLNYTPGLITAIMLNLPLGLITLSKNRSSCKNKKQFYQHIGIGLVVVYLIFALVMALVSFLVD